MVFLSDLQRTSDAMADQDDLVARIRSNLTERAPAERKMFGGVCFMINGKMLAGTFKGDLLVRVGKDGHDAALQHPHTRPMEQAGRVAAGYVIVAGEGIARDRELKRWLDIALAFVETLPAKLPAKKKSAPRPARVAKRTKPQRSKGEKK
jgi:TfoX/Sxy family transcriptional regulator of competence genes